MKICLISHAFVEEGYQPALRTLAKQPGVELALVTPEAYRVGLQTSSGVFQASDTSYRVYPLPIFLAGRQGSFVYHPSKLMAALKEFQPQVILHEQEVFALGAGQVAHFAAQQRVPLVMQVWENVDRKLALPRRWLRSFVLKRCSGLFAGNQRCGELHRQWGFTGAMEVVQSMAVNKINEDPDFGPRKPGVLQVVYVGRLIHLKGVDCLLNALAGLRRDAVPFNCVIAGHGDQIDALKHQAKQLFIDDAVRFAGLLTPPEVIALLRVSDVLVLPSRRSSRWEEQFGRVFVEAMSEGVATVGSRTGAIPDVIDSEDLTFPENDCAALKHILKTLAADSEVLTRHQKRLWQRARDLYVDDALAKKKVAFLRRLLLEVREP